MAYRYFAYAVLSVLTAFLIGTIIAIVRDDGPSFSKRCAQINGRVVTERVGKRTEERCALTFADRVWEKAQ